MPRYFLNIWDGHHLIEDEEGMAADTIAQARDEAVQGARDILAEKLRSGEVMDGQRIEIADAEGTVLEVVPFRSVIRLPEH